MNSPRLLVLLLGVAIGAAGFVGLARADSSACHGTGTQDPSGWGFICSGDCPPNHGECVIYDSDAPTRECSCGPYVITRCHLTMTIGPLGGNPTWEPVGACFENPWCSSGDCTLVIETGNDPEEPVTITASCLQ